MHRMHRFISLTFLLLLATVALLPANARAQADKGQTLPPESRLVVAEGRAAIGVGGIPGARRAATAQALRAAVEKALGVYVSARTLTQNYQMVRDQITTQADGFATLEEVVRETVLGQEVQVVVRARVCLRPLAERLKALKLTRDWRVYVSAASASSTSDDALVVPVEQALTEAGFVVVRSITEADVRVQVAPQYTSVQNTPLDTAAGPMTMHTVRAAVHLRAVRVGTGEMVAALMDSETALHISAPTARREAATEALARLAPRMADALLLLPAQQAQPIALSVGALQRATTVAELEDALQSLPGVQRVSRRSWRSGVALWELSVLADAVPLLPRELEQGAALRPFRLRVSGETRAKITATALPGKMARQ